MPTFLTIGLQQATTRVLSLWNGTSNNPATGFGVGFDDSAWPFSVNPAHPVINRTLPYAVLTPLPALPPGVEAIAPWVNAPSTTARFVWRAHFTPPAPPYELYMIEGYGPVMTDDFVNARSPAVSLNGNSTTNNWDTLKTQVIPGDNLLFGMIGNNINWTFSTIAWISIRLTFYIPDSGGTVYSWGTITPGVNDKGVLGVGDTLTHLTPTPVAAVPTNIVKAASNGKTSLFLTGGGDVWVCGDNSTGLLGSGSTDISVHAAPVRRTSVDSVVDIAIGNDCAMALDRFGLVFMWGPNAHGSCGTGSTAPFYFTGVTETTNPGSVDAIAAGGDFSIRQKMPRGALYSAGGNAMGQLGRGSSGADILTYGQVLNTLNPNPTAFAAGDQQLLAVRSGLMWGCGKAVTGSLGWNCFSAGTGPSKVVNTLTNSGLSADDVQQAGPLSFLRIGTSVFALGDGTPHGGAGDGNGTIVYGTTAGSPQGQVVDTTLVKLYPALASGGGGLNNPYSPGNSQAVFGALGTDGKLYTWGYGGYGQMGSGADPTANLFAASLNGLGNVIHACSSARVMFAVAGSAGPPPQLWIPFPQVIG